MKLVFAKKTVGNYEWATSLIRNVGPVSCNILGDVFYDMSHFILILGFFLMGH